MSTKQFEASGSQSTSPALLLGLTGLRIDGGIASVNRAIVRTLEEQLRNGALTRVDRALLNEDPNRPPPPPLRGEERLSHNSQLHFVWDCWRLIRRNRPDIVFFDHVGLAQAVLPPLPSLPPERYAVFVHGGELGYARTGRRARALRGAWRILVNSPFTAGLVREAFPDRADRIHVTTLCIDPDRIAAWQENEDSCASEPVQPRERAALIVGRMLAEEPGKGHDELIGAWPSVLATVPDAKLWVVGAGDDQPRLERRVAELGLDDAVHFFGRVSDEELHALYRRASLFAMPSTQEGFGLVYAEALWHRLPCLGSTADAASCVIDDGKTGALLPYGDVGKIATAVTRFLSDPDLVTRMGEAGRRAVEQRFTYAGFRARLLEALDIVPMGG